MDTKYVKYAQEKTFELLEIDSPTGYTEAGAKWVKETFDELGFDAKYTNKGGVFVDLGGGDAQGALLLQGHIDTIGGMVREIKSNGRLHLTQLGGLHPDNAETENVRVRTRDGKCYEGTFQLINPSAHVNPDAPTTLRTWETTEVVLDEDVKSADDVRALGIEVGDIVCFEPRTRLTEKGFIKSRFLDDKLCVGILIAFAKAISDGALTLSRRVYIHFTIYEEVGYGGPGMCPEGVTDGIALDMGCVGEGITGDEHKVSICAKDAFGPYSYVLTSALIEAAKKEGADYAVDVYPKYSSDIDTTIRSGADIRHGLIGPGIFASHGYERGHMDGVLNTLKVLKGYCTK